MNRNGWAINSLWRIALVLVVVTQLFLLALRTPPGQRAIPLALIHMGMLRPRAAIALVSLVHPSETDGVEALAQQIETLNPRLPLVADVTNRMHDRAVAQLAYRIYPRSFTQRITAQSSPATDECLIFWPSQTVIVLSCPGSVWRYDENPGGSR